MRTTLLFTIALAACGDGHHGDVVGADAPTDTSIADDGSTPIDGELPDGNVTSSPSCANLSSMCGATGAETSCCLTATVPAQTYHRGWDVAGDQYSGTMGYTATVRSIRLEMYEVTVGRFRAFLDAGGGTRSSPPVPGSGAHPWIADSGWQATWNTLLLATKSDVSTALHCAANKDTWTDATGAQEQRPINCVTWYEAMAFCAWDGGFLPTEAEWAAASSGGDQQRAFPWSVPASSTTITQSYASYECLADGDQACTRADILAVGTLPMGAGRWGHLDLAGNLSEWVFDGYDDDSPYPCTDCAVTTGSFRGLGGGSVATIASSLRASRRSALQATGRVYSAGFRCARAI